MLLKLENFNAAKLTAVVRLTATVTWCLRTLNILSLLRSSQTFGAMTTISNCLFVFNRWNVCSLTETAKSSQICSHLVYSDNARLFRWSVYWLNMTLQSNILTYDVCRCSAWRSSWWNILCFTNTFLALTRATDRSRLTSITKYKL